MNYYLSLAALVPVVLLFIRVYRLDRIEKEPRVLLGKLIGLGALAAVPAAQTLGTQAAKIRPAVPARRVKGGQLQFAEAQFHLTALGDFYGIVKRLRNSRKKRSHLLFGF